MSKTDKDAPYWVRAEWYEAYHSCCEHGIFHYWQGGLASKYCDLPDEPKIEHHLTKSKTRCEWFPVVHASHYDMPPPWFINHVWWAPERTRERAKLSEMIKEYRATGDIDYEFQNFHHKNCARWMWS